MQTIARNAFFVFNTSKQGMTRALHLGLLLYAKTGATACGEIPPFLLHSTVSIVSQLHSRIKLKGTSPVFCPLFFRAFEVAYLKGTPHSRYNARLYNAHPTNSCVLILLVEKEILQDL